MPLGSGSGGGGGGGGGSAGRAATLLGEALVALVEREDSPLAELELAGDHTAKPGSYAIGPALLPMLEALQNNEALSRLDISGNDVGPAVRPLATY